MSSTPWTGRSDELHKYWTMHGIPEYRQEMMRLIIGLLWKDEKLDVLDAGCGTGLLYKYLPDWAKERYTGLDFTDEMVEYCRKEHSRGRFLQGNILDWIDVLHYSIIVTQNVLQHIVPWQFAAANLIDHASEALIFCEASNQNMTHVTMYEPVISWSFREGDMIETLKYLCRLHNKKDWNPRVVARPRDTGGRPGQLAIYGMRRP